MSKVVTYRVMTRNDGDAAHTFDIDTADGATAAKAMFDDLIGKQKMWATKNAASGPVHVKAYEPGEDLLFHRQLIGG